MTTVSRAADPTDWDAIWRQGVAPGTRFDIAQPHAWLTAAIAAGTIPNGRILIPGAGRGYDVAALASPARFAVGLDISPTCTGEAEAYLSKNAPAGQYQFLSGPQDGDFFEHSPAEQYDAAYDLTFLCALPPALREAWAKKYAELIKPGGKLITLQFPLRPEGHSHPRDQPPNYFKGPPYLLSHETYRALLLPAGFELEHHAEMPAELSVPKRAGCESVAIWRRK